MQCLIWNQLQCAVHQQVLVNPSERVNDPIPPLYVRMAFTVAEAHAGEFQLVIVVL